MTINYGLTKELVVWKSTPEDQKLALEIVDGVLRTLVIEKKMLMNDPEIVDIDKFVDLPYNLREAATTTNTVYTKNVGTTTVYNNAEYEARKKKEEEEKARQEKMRYTPFIFKRSGGLPSEEALKSIKKNVVGLSTGEYKPPELPTINEKTECKGTA
jgi:hypothetical protein